MKTYFDRGGKLLSLKQTPKICGTYMATFHPCLTVGLIQLFISFNVTRLGDVLHFGQLFKSLTFLGNFCKGVKIYHFSSEIIFGQLLWTFGDFFWSH